MDTLEENEKDGRIDLILDLVLKLAKSESSDIGKGADKGEGLVAIISGLNALRQELESKSTYIDQQKKRTNELVDILLEYTMMDFSRKVEISETGDELDAIGLGLNTLGEELESHIGQLRENEKTLIEQSEDLLRSNKEMEQFAFIASHDLQEPLRTIANYLELVEREYSSSFDNKELRYLNFMQSATVRMQSLIRDLLEYSRIGQHRNLQEVDCNKVLKDVLHGMADTIKETNTTITTEQLPVLKAYTGLASLFQNLISNAIKFRERDVPVTITITCKDSIKGWLFAIKDDGIGIEEKYHERIFSIFQRLHSQKIYPGTGIGLAHCKKIVELHHGKIWVESTFGIGSTFYFSIQK